MLFDTLLFAVGLAGVAGLVWFGWRSLSGKGDDDARQRVGGLMIVVAAVLSYDAHGRFVPTTPALETATSAVTIGFLLVGVALVFGPLLVER